MPKIAVITPVYATSENNRLVLLEDTIKSMHRLPDDFVQLIVDDGSSINVRNLVMSYNSIDSRIRYLRRERQPNDLCTASNALNYGINQVLDSEEYKDIEAITTLHSDDLMLDVGKRFDALKESIGAVFADIIKFDGISYAKLKKGREINPDMLVQSGSSKGINHPSIMWRKDFAQSMRDYNLRYFGTNGLYMPDIRYAEDRAVIKLTIFLGLVQDLEVKYVDSIAMLIRAHESSITQTINYASLERDRRKVDKLYYPTSRSLFENADFLRTIFNFIYRPNKGILRRLRSKFSKSPSLEFVRELQKQLDAIKTPHQTSTSLTCS